MTESLAPTAGFRLDGSTTSFRELASSTWRSCGLIAILARKDFYVRYRRATFGLLWAAALLPLLQAVVLAVVVSKFAKFDTGSHYAVYVLAGTVPWGSFSAIVSTGSTAIVDGSGLSTKIYFPRVVLPLVAVWASAYGLLISLGTLLVMTVLFGGGLGPEVVLLVPAALLLLLLSASLAVVLSALHVYFRDVRYLVTAALTVWLYLTPVFYPLGAVGRVRTLIEANPVTGVVELFRAATVGADPGWTVTLWWTGAWCVALVAASLVLHRRFDRLFVDLL